MSAAMPRTLYVVRHGKAVKEIPSGEDFNRPLTAQGRADVRRLGPLTGAAPPERIWCSPARRTRETAEGLVESSPTPAPAPVFDERIYAASHETLLQVLAETPAEVASAAIVGHNPGVTDLVRTLLGPDDEGLGPIVPGTLVALFTTYAWDALRPGACRLIRYEPPE
jgi:phosphohistidine phosphatase